MSKRKRSRTQQGIAGVTIPQGLSLERDEIKDYINVRKHLSQFERNGNDIRMPLNRQQRRLAKKLKIDIKKV